LTPVSGGGRVSYLVLVPKNWNDDRLARRTETKSHIIICYVEIGKRSRDWQHRFLKCSVTWKPWTNGVIQLVGTAARGRSFYRYQLQ